MNGLLRIRMVNAESIGGRLGIRLIDTIDPISQIPDSREQQPMIWHRAGPLEVWKHTAAGVIHNGAAERSGKALRDTP
jgi:hypothetical protein